MNKEDILGQGLGKCVGLGEKVEGGYKKLYEELYNS
jgi:hypothetical protein